MINYYSIPKNRGQAFLRKDPYNFPRKMAFFLYIVSMVRTIGRDSVFCPHFSGKRKFPPGRVFAPFPEKNRIKTGCFSLENLCITLGNKTWAAPHNGNCGLRRIF